MSGTTYTPSYTVDLVSLPSTTPAATAKPVSVKPKAQPKPVPEKKVSKPDESVAPKEVLEEFKPSGGDEAARLERRKKIEELEMETRRLYETFTSEDAGVTEESQPGETSADLPPATSAPAGVSGNQNSIRFRAYYDLIWAQIRASWVLPEGVTSGTKLLTKARISIAPDGTIEQFWIEKKSGNDYYDQSVLRAISRAKHLPPLPEELSGSPFEVGLNFKYPPE
jgi:colicin import membrane protein